MDRGSRDNRTYSTTKLPTLREGVCVATNRDLMIKTYDEACQTWHELVAVGFRLLAIVPSVSLLLLATVLSSEGSWKGTHCRAEDSVQHSRSPIRLYRNATYCSTCSFTTWANLIRPLTRLLPIRRGVATLRPDAKCSSGNRLATGIPQLSLGCDSGTGKLGVGRLLPITPLCRINGVVPGWERNVGLFRSLWTLSNPQPNPQRAMSCTTYA
jgi:hypothetical protein